MKLSHYVRSLVAVLALSLVLGAFSTNALASSVSDERVFAYAEANFPDIFRGSHTAGQYQQFNYRYYPATGNYLAVDTDDMIYILGPITGNVLTPVCPVSALEHDITAWETTQAVSETTAPGSTGACSFFPSTLGSTWKYAVSGPEIGSFTQDVVVTSGNGSSVTQSTTAGGAYPSTMTQDYLVNCNQAKAVGSRITSMGTTTSVSNSPALLVSPSDFTIGYRESGSAQTTGITQLDGGCTMTTTQTITQSFEVLGQETLTVPAGTFNAVKVQHVLTTSSGTGTMSCPSMSDTYDLPGSTLTMTTWFVSGVGWIKSSSPYLDGDTELVSYSIK